MHHDRLVAPADLHLRTRERIGGNTGSLADFFRDDGLAIKCFRHVLQPRGDIDRVAQRREYGMAAKANVADDDFTGMDAYTVLDGLAHFGGELMIQVSDIRGDERGSTQCLPARLGWIGPESEQCKHSVTDKLIRL